MKTRRVLAIAAALTALTALPLTACGDDDGGEASGSAATKTDGAFVAGMVPHHEAAIEMAELAEEQGQHPEIVRLAAEIISAQEAEIEELEADYEGIFGEPLAEGAGHGTLGLDEEMSGMAMDAASLDGAEPFDRHFIDMMIPHHQGAIRMARVELERGEDGELQEIATAIIAAQSREIDQMNEWRERWYGAPSPAGGVPDEDEEGAMPAHESMGH
jgi:uncharacterized protein (DUF305 family)